MNDTNQQPLEGEVVDTIPQDIHPAPGGAMQVVAANPYLPMIARVLDKGGDISNIEKLLDLQLRWDANEARKAFVDAMAAFKAEPMEILKRKVVSFETRDGDVTSYRHAELSDVTDAVVPAMGKHGLSHRWDVKQESGQITVTCTITHRLGHSESVSLTAAPDNSGKKNAIQQVASAVTYLQRYTLLASTGMATKGMDDDGRTGGAAEEDDERAAYEEAMKTWHDGITACHTVEALRSIKAEMVAAFKGANAIPVELQNRFNERWKEVSTVHAEPAKS